MPQAPLDPSTLSSFSNAAAGHDGVLSDPSGQLVIKPCTPAEIAFYESLTTHPELQPFLPTYMGTLQLNKADETASISENGAVRTAAGLSLNDAGPMHGKKLSTETSIVLENVAAGFKKPNIMDIKLGARLYDENTKEEKAARLDKVASETTSKSLGFRIAGMRVYKGTSPQGERFQGTVESEQATDYLVYNKLYGRAFTAEDVLGGFKTFFSVPDAGVDKEMTSFLAEAFEQEVKDLLKTFEGLEARMFSASLLLVYEGNAEAFKEKRKQINEMMNGKAPAQDDEDDEEAIPKTHALKLIDFAHATWRKGEGADENMLQGVRSTVKLLGELAANFA